MIDFGFSTIEGVRNPEIDKEIANISGISTKSHPMYDAHYFLNIIHKYSNNSEVRKFVKDLFPNEYIGVTTKYIKDYRLRLIKHKGLPTYDDIMNHSFMQGKKINFLSKVTSKKPVVVKRVEASKNVGTSSAIRRAKAILQKDAEKKKTILKRPGIVAVKPSISINKNGDLKIEKRKCRLYKKDELVKLFKLNPKLKKEQMCKIIKNM